MKHEDYSKLKMLIPAASAAGCPAEISLQSINDIPLHIHDGVELLYVLKGSVNIRISFNSYKLTEGDFLLINNYEVHSMTSDDTCNAVLLAHCDKGFFMAEEELFIFDPQIYRTYYGDKVEQIKKLLATFYLDLHTDQDRKGREERALNSILEISQILRDHFLMHHFDPVNKRENPLNESKRKIGRIESTYKFFYSSYEEPIRLDCLAEREYIDKYYAAHLIKSGTGTSFQETLNIIRIDRSEVFLLGTDHSIGKISELAGFSSQSYYRKQFGRYFGMTPGEYRKKFKSKTYPAKEMEYHPISREAHKRLNDAIRSVVYNNKFNVDNLVLVGESLMKIDLDLSQIMNALGRPASSPKKIKRIIIEFEE